MTREPKTFKQHRERSWKDRQRQLTPMADDGLLIIAVKVLCYPSNLIMWCIFYPATWILDRVACGLFRVCNFIKAFKESELSKGFDLAKDGDGETRWWTAIDAYMVAWTAILCALCWWAADRADGWRNSTYEFVGWDGDWSRPIVVLAVLAALIRLYEIFTVLALLHSELKYQPPRLIRSLINTIWHYCEVTLIFAILYIITHLAIPDPFIAVDSLEQNAPESVVYRHESQLKEFLASPLNPVYFSFVTITTLGYGDFSPVSVLGKSLVVVEVIWGFFILVIVLQRAMSAGQRDAPKSIRHPGWNNLRG